MPEDTGQIVNLRRARKGKVRATAAKVAAANRAKFGRTRAERDAGNQTHALESKRFDAHKRETGSAPDDDPCGQ